MARFRAQPVLLAVFLALAASGAAVPAAATGTVVRWVVTGAPQTVAAAVDRAKTAGDRTRLVRAYRHFPVFLAEGPEGGAGGTQVEAWRAQGLTVEADRQLQLFDVQGNALTGADALQAQGWDGSGEVVAILDSGVDYGHSALGGGGFPNAVVVGGWDFGDGDSDPADLLGHGTAVASVIAAPWGVAPGAAIVALKVTPGGTAQTPLSAVLAALDWVIAERQRLGITIVSMAIGEGFHAGVCDSAEPAWAAAVTAVVRAGIPVFAGTGNSGNAGAISAPACVSAAIAVSSVYDSRGLQAFSFRDAWGAPLCTDAAPQEGAIPCYANRGLALDLLAPSECSRVALAGGGSHPCFGGTSAATPYAAGAAALLRSAVGDLSPGELRWRLRRAAVAVADEGAGAAGGPYRRIDVDAARAAGGAPEDPGTRVVPGVAPAQRLALHLLNTGAAAAPVSVRGASEVAAELTLAPGEAREISAAAPVVLQRGPGILAQGIAAAAGWRGSVSSLSPAGGVGFAEPAWVVVAGTASGHRFTITEVAGAPVEVELAAILPNGGGRSSALVSLAAGEERVATAAVLGLPENRVFEVRVVEGKGRAAVSVAQGSGASYGVTWASPWLAVGSTPADSEVRLAAIRVRRRGAARRSTRLTVAAGGSGAILEATLAPAAGGAPRRATLELSAYQLWEDTDAVRRLFGRDAVGGTLTMRVIQGEAALGTARRHGESPTVETAWPLWGEADGAGPGGFLAIPALAPGESPLLHVAAGPAEVLAARLEVLDTAGTVVGGRDLALGAGGSLAVTIDELAAPADSAWLRLTPATGRAWAALELRGPAPLIVPAIAAGSAP